MPCVCVSVRVRAYGVCTYVTILHRGAGGFQMQEMLISIPMHNSILIVETSLLLIGINYANMENLRENPSHMLHIY